MNPVTFGKVHRQGRADPRYKTRRWKRVRLEILYRDLWQCQIRGQRCRGTANQVDHITSPHPALGGADFWDPDNLRAACAPCNNGRNNPAFLEQRAPVDSPVANLSLRSRWRVVPTAYSRRKTDDGDSSR